MICRADFEELFPEIFRPTPMSGSRQSPTEECLARWEDDGGRPSVRAPEYSRNVRRADWPDPMLNLAMGMAMINTAVHMATENALGPGRRADTRAAAM